MKTLVLILPLLVTPALAQTSDPIRMSGGLICDTVEDVTTFIATFELNTCGRLLGSVVGTVTPLAKFSHNGKTYTIVKYDFGEHPAVPQIQYGWWGAPVEDVDA